MLFEINRKMVNRILFRVDLMRFRNKFLCVWLNGRRLKLSIVIAIKKQTELLLLITRMRLFSRVSFCFGIKWNSDSNDWNSNYYSVHFDKKQETNSLCFFFRRYFLFCEGNNNGCEILSFPKINCKMQYQ